MAFILFSGNFEREMEERLSGLGNVFWRLTQFPAPSAQRAFSLVATESLNAPRMIYWIDNTLPASERALHIKNY